MRPLGSPIGALWGPIGSSGGIGTLGAERATNLTQKGYGFCYYRVQ